MIQEFLQGRTQRVSVNGYRTHLTTVSSGILKGSVLRPVHFVLFNNDLPDVVINVVSLFADDKKLCGKATMEEDREMIHEDMNKLSDWTDQLFLKFNTAKYSVTVLVLSKMKK